MCRRDGAANDSCKGMCQVKVGISFFRLSLIAELPVNSKICVCAYTAKETCMYIASIQRYRVMVDVYHVLLARSRSSDASPSPGASERHSNRRATR